MLIFLSCDAMDSLSWVATRFLCLDSEVEIVLPRKVTGEDAMFLVFPAESVNCLRGSSLEQSWQYEIHLDGLRCKSSSELS